MNALAQNGWVRDGLIWRNPALVAARDTPRLRLVPTCDNCGGPKSSATYKMCASCRAAAPAECSDCGARVSGHDVKRCVPCHLIFQRTQLHPLEIALLDTLARNFASTVQPVTTHGTCDACGCLLLGPDEHCPSCLAWAERDAIRASWRTTSTPDSTREVAA